MHWFEINRRILPWRCERDPYRILVAEKLLQKTDVGHVMRVYNKFLIEFPDIFCIDSASKEELESVLMPLGLWRIRARDFKLMARYLIEVHNGDIPKSLEELMNVPGVGYYVASAMLCFCFEEHQALVDINVRRVAKRIFFWTKELPSDTSLSLAMQDLIPLNASKEFNWALFDFSARICSRTPHCDRCFANDICEYFNLSKKNR